MMKGLLAQVEKEFAIRGIDDALAAEVVRKVPALKNRRVVGGYASVTIVDREGHKITKEALVEATNRFMNEIYYRPINVFHCLTGETKVRTTAGYKNIETIKVGDRVYTHTGKSQKVTKTTVHENNGLA